MNIRPTIIGAIIGDLLGSYYLKKDASSIDFRNLPDNLKPSLDTLIITEMTNICRPFKSIEDDNHRANVAVWMPYARRNDPDWKIRGFSKEYAIWCKKFDAGKHAERYKYSGDPAILLRTIPIAFYYKYPESVLQKAELLSKVTSSDISEINAAKAIALAIHLAYSGSDKEAIVQELSKTFNTLNISAFGLPYNPVEMSIKAIMDSCDFESAIRNAISYSQGLFNLATITGALAAAYYHSIPDDLAYLVRTKLTYSIQYMEIDFFRKLRKCDLIKVKTKPEVCPLCGSRVVDIKYGLVSSVLKDLLPKPLLLKDQENERHVILGGCCIMGNDSKWGCVGCEVKFNDVDQPTFEDLLERAIRAAK